MRKTVWRIAGACAALALAAAIASAQTTGTISGTVTDSATAAPLASGASLDLLVRVFDSAGNQVMAAPTGGAGQYSFTGLNPGTYYVRATTTTSGYVGELHANIPCVSTDCAATSGTAVVLGAGATETVDFALSRGGAFSGTVRRGSDSSPVQGANVVVFNASTSFVKTVQSGAGGTYTVDGLPAGSYFARVTEGSAPLVGAASQLYAFVSCPEFKAIGLSECRIASGTPIVVAGGATTTGIDFALNGAAFMRGTVTEDGTGAPINNAVVELYLGDQRIQSVNTGSSNIFTFLDVPSGFYRIRTAMQSNYIDEWYGGLCVGCPGTPLAFEGGGSTNFAGLNLSLSPGGRISGTIACALPSPEVWTLPPIISAYNATTGLLARQLDTTGIAACSATTPQSWPYTLSGLAAGQYYLVARDTPVVPFGIRVPGGILIDQLYSGVPCVTIDCDPRRGVPVTVPPGGITAGIDFNMTVGARSQALGGGGSGPPLRLFDARGVELTNVRRIILAPPFLQELVGVPPGTYFATIGNYLHGRGLCVNCPPTAGRPIVIQPGQSTFTLDFTVAPDTTMVSGTVRDEAGAAPLSTITVELLSEAGMLIGSGVTDRVGRYSITTAGPGTYLLRTSNARGYVDEVYPDVSCATCDLRAGTPVVVASASVTGIDFTLARGGLVSGFVHDSRGQPVPGTPVSVLTSAGALIGRTEAAYDSTYHATVPAGTYRVRAEATVNHGANLFDREPCTSADCNLVAADPVVVATGASRTGVHLWPDACSAMTISPSIMASAVFGRAYRQVFTVAGGTAPIAFDVTGGVLPAGLSLTSGGVLSGTPGSNGRHQFSVAAIDAAGCGTSRTVTLDVHACAFTVSPASASVPAAGGDVTIAIGNSCGPMAVDVAGTFVTVQSSSASQVVLTVPPNVGGSSRSATVTIGRRAVIVNQGGLAMQPPFGSLDGPADGSQVSGSVGVGGWALDDLEVRRVRIYRDPVGGEPAAQVLLGDAVFVPGARPDVRLAYPTFPNNDRAGWGFLILTNMLPNQGNGLFRIYAYAEDAEGLQALLGARTIIASNATSTLPFGAIDTPAQGATISGSAYINFGWALTPQPKVIPFDGSTIAILVDGQSVGSPTYNQFRADIAAFFPGYANSAGAVGYRALDTTALAEGIHTIAWIVADNQGAAAGIGSRYFTVANSADAQAPLEAGVEQGRRTESLEAMPVAETAVVAQRASSVPTDVIANRNGPRRVRLRALDRLELRLDDLVDRRACTATWVGYLIDDKMLKALPVGASIDPAGTFFWQPGPGFSGSFDLSFVRTGCDGRKERLPVRVTIDK
jgi:hypothetical protein